MRLLIVDDNEQNRYMLQVLLEGHGYQVASARDGAEALEVARREPPDMVISDILMPVMDGFALCREWKRDEELKAVPFIFYTATYTDPKDEEFALSLGAERFIIKPQEPDVFMEVVREVFETYETGRLVALRQPVEEEAVFFREYNEVLIRKLEDKLVQLEEANRTLEREITEHRQAEEELRRYRDHLEELVTQRTAELSEQMGETEQLNRALADLLEDIQVSNRNLERTTEQLKQANEELESFSYSVSHDLRAPLRAIDGLSRILQEDYAPELSPEAQRYLALVRDNAEQMAQLIDDLLAFSHLSRRSLSKRSVSPADLVHQVLEELAHEYEGRQVEFVIGDLPACQADPSLLKQVYVNLLANALKYTREREIARIEIGALEAADLGGSESQIPDLQSPIYFVRDNGVGFDMRYADRLFGVFQRLHRAEDYEGTGVGLAIVQRIIRRHGGRVWAEAEVDRGATFYFTI
jgi:signal transduction histidine kinase